MLLQDVSSALQMPKVNYMHMPQGGCDQTYELSEQSKQAYYLGNIMRMLPAPSHQLRSKENAGPSKLARLSYCTQCLHNESAQLIETL